MTKVLVFDLGGVLVENDMFAEFELRMTPVDFIGAFTGWPKGFYAGAEDLLSGLRQRYLTACLSNSNSLHWTTKVTCHFDQAYSSHLLNKIKPDAEVFSVVTMDVGCEAGEVSFFDDSPLNVQAAQAFGWDAHLTVGYESLLAVLNQMGALSK